MLSEMNKMKRLLFAFYSFRRNTDDTFQVFSYKRASNVGSPLRTRRRTMTSFGAHVMKERQHGFWRVMYLTNGKQQGFCSGFTGNVSLPNYRRASPD